MSSAGACKHIGRMSDVEMELTTPGAFPRTVCHAFVNRLASEGLTRFGGNDGARICTCQGKIRQWLATGRFRVLRSIYALKAFTCFRDCSSTEALPARFLFG